MNVIPYDNYNSLTDTPQFDAFIIGPSQNASEYQKKQFDKYLENMYAQGKEIHYTNPIYNDDLANFNDMDLQLIANSKEIHIWWDSNNVVHIFEELKLHILDKPINIPNKNAVEEVPGKSYINMVAWGILNNRESESLVS